MMPISGSAGFDPTQMQQKLQQNFKNADTDDSQSVSKTEAKDALAETGMSEDMFNKMFDKMDANGDGEVSQLEQEEVFAQMQERMQKFAGGGFPGIGNSGSESTLDTLLESLSEDSDDDDEKSELEQALERLREDPNSPENRKYAGELINGTIPVVNTTA